MQRFEIAEAEISDIDALVDVHESSMQNDPIYQRIFRDVAQEAVRDFSRSNMRQKFDCGYHKYFKVTEVSTRTIVAWAGLEYPHVPNTAQEANNYTIPPVGTHEELFQVWTGPLSRELSTECGYDPRMDFHRAGTRVAPSYQHKGLATMLTLYLNEIVETLGRRLFVCVRPAAVRMCEKNGYQKIARHSVDLRHFDGRGLDTSVVFVRTPKGE